VRYAGERDEALHIVLRECGEIAEDDRGRRDDREQRNDEILIRREHLDQYDQHREAGCF
jgi:hypothetical protein